jgi:alkylation response protein AidB-like acyl-CoA dehydrogenase
MIDRFEVRRADYSLDEDQRAVRGMFRDFFAKECPTTLVRAAEPLGHAPALWAKLDTLGGASLGIPSDADTGASLVDLLLGAEELGRAAAPIPFITQVVALRALARAEAKDVLDRVLEDGELIAVSPQPDRRDGQLVLPGAIASSVLAFDHGEFVMYRGERPGELVPNTGNLPLAAWSAEGKERIVIPTRDASGAFRQLLDEWRLLTASALVGLTDAALALAVDFVKTRQTMGVPVGALQGVSHPLADVAIGVHSARHLTWRAGWLIEHEAHDQSSLVALTYAYAARVAAKGTSVSAHMQGGQGFTIESDASLYFLRAKGWSVIAGDPQAGLREVGKSMLSAANPGEPA